jgi:hypothetical protein
MKRYITVLIALALWTTPLFGADATPSSTNVPSNTDFNKLMFTDVRSCEQASIAYKSISIGAPLQAVMELKDTPLPKGLYWPEYPQDDGSVLSHAVSLPPKEWGTNYVARTDGQSQKQFYFFHDTTTVTRIIWSTLQLTTTPQVGPVLKGIPQESDPQKPIGPLIMMKEEK